MISFLIYEGKVAIALAVFYMFYRLMLRKETFHRLNRGVLVGTVVLAFVLPLCIITIHRPMEMDAQALVLSELPADGMAQVVEESAPWWPVALTILFWAGAAFVLVRVMVSILSIVRVVRRGEVVREEEGCKIVVTERDIDPFSWMRFIVLSQKDWEGNPAPIITHEKAHIGYGHSVELLIVDVISAFQWFNPAIWMLRADLQELHEYEADDAVLRAGTNIKEYFYGIGNNSNHYCVFTDKLFPESDAEIRFSVEDHELRKIYADRYYESLKVICYANISLVSMGREEYDYLSIQNVLYDNDYDSSDMLEPVTVPTNVVDGIGFVGVYLPSTISIRLPDIEVGGMVY